MSEQETKDTRFPENDPASKRTPTANRAIGLAWILGGLAVLAIPLGLIYVVLHLVMKLW